ECPKIKRAFKFARIVCGWGGWFFVRLVFAVGVIVGVGTRWYYGLAVFVVLHSCLFAVRRQARCPHCGSVWTSEELESFICGQCRLNIGLGLRE
ncbi:MAG: hypothetical protein NTW03_16270, partial [Verrucomicrobia bacterium]|nr:hypothetical protein [Verrucomicrobiota bacterium]